MSLYLDKALSQNELAEMSFYLTNKWNIAGESDSDNDGLVDSIDTLPLDGTILRYTLDGEIDWVAVAGKDAEFEKGTIKYRLEEKDTVDDLIIGIEANKSSIIQIYEGELSVTKSIVGQKGVGVFEHYDGDVEIKDLIIADEASSQGTYKLMGGYLKVLEMKKGKGNSTFTWTGGTLSVSSANINLNNSGNGVLSPGESPGIVVLNGNYTQGSSAQLYMELGGMNANNPVQYDQLIVNGTLSLSGSLKVVKYGGFEPVGGAVFKILSFENISGTFSEVKLPRLDRGLEWDSSKLYTEGVITVLDNSPWTVKGIIDEGSTQAITQFNSVTIPVPLYIGVTSNGMLNISNEGALTTNRVVLGVNNTGDGNLSILGGSLLNATENMIIGDRGIGEVSLSNSKIYSKMMGIGQKENAKGEIIIEDNGLLDLTQVLQIGISGEGLVSQNKGIVSANKVILGVSELGQGNYTLSGGLLNTPEIIKGLGAASLEFIGGTIQTNRVGMNMVNQGGILKSKTKSGLIANCWGLYTERKWVVRAKYSRKH